jgi:hypothetical protein
VYDAGHDGNTVYIVSEFIDGPTLRDWLKNHRRDANTTARLGAQLASALHHAHEAGLVHRDVKPSNILMDQHDDPHITDFGLAKRDAGETTITGDGQVLGTPAYMPPEEARGESHSVDCRADVYSLGVILYEMLAGVRPFQGTGQALVQQILDEAPAPLRRHNRQVPVELETICLKCLAKSPTERFQSAGELADEVHRFLRGDPIHSRPVGWARRFWRRCLRHRLVTGLSAGLAVCLVALAIVALPDWLPQKPIREADAGQWLRDEFCTLNFLPVRGALLQDAQYPLPVELTNRTDQPLDITQIDVEVYNADVARVLGSPSPLVFRQSFQVPIHFEKYQHRLVQIPGGQMLPQELVARISYASRRETSDFRIRRAGVETPFPPPQSLPPAAISRGLDSGAALQRILPRATAWRPDATLYSMIAPDRQILADAATGLELVVVEGWLITFVSHQQGGGRSYHVTAESIEESDLAELPSPCLPVALPRLGNQQALELASRSRAIAAGWNGSRLADVPVAMKGPRLKQGSVEGQASLVWFLPYLGYDAVPIVVEAESGARVRLVNGQWKRFAWDRPADGSRR